MPLHTNSLSSIFCGEIAKKKHNLGSAKLHNRCIQFSLKLVKALHLGTSAARPIPQHAHEFSTSSKLTADKLPTVVAAPRNRSKNDQEFWKSAAQT